MRARSVVVTALSLVAMAGCGGGPEIDSTQVAPGAARPVAAAVATTPAPPATTSVETVTPAPTVAAPAPTVASTTATTATTTATAVLAADDDTSLRILSRGERDGIPVDRPAPDPISIGGSFVAVAPPVPADSAPAVIAPADAEVPAERAVIELPARVLVAGDSTGVELGVELGSFAAAHPEQLVVTTSAFFGCGMSASDDGRLHEWDAGRQTVDLRGCTGQWRSIPERIAADSIDVVLVSIGTWDGTDIRLADGARVNVLDPVGRALVTDAYRAFVDTVRAAGAEPVWVRPVDIDVDWAAKADPIDDPARWVVMREIVDSLGVRQVDLPAFLTAAGLDGPVGRPDGVHLSSAALARFVAEAVVPTLLG